MEPSPPEVTIVDPHAPEALPEPDLPRPPILRRPLRLLAALVAAAALVGTARVGLHALDERQLDRAAERAVELAVVETLLDPDAIQIRNDGPAAVTVTELRLPALGFSSDRLDLGISAGGHTELLVGRGFRCDEQALAAHDVVALLSVRTSRGTTTTRRTTLEATVTRVLVHNLRTACGLLAPIDAVRVRDTEIRGGRVTLTLVNTSVVPVTVVLDSGQQVVVPAQEKALLMVPSRQLGCGGRDEYGVRVRVSSRLGDGPLFLDLSHLAFEVLQACSEEGLGGALPR